MPLKPSGVQPGANKAGPQPSVTFNVGQNRTLRVKWEEIQPADYDDEHKTVNGKKFDLTKDIGILVLKWACGEHLETIKDHDTYPIAGGGNVGFSREFTLASSSTFTNTTFATMSANAQGFGFGLGAGRGGVAVPSLELNLADLGHVSYSKADLRTPPPRTPVDIVEVHTPYYYPAYGQQHTVSRKFFGSIPDSSDWQRDAVVVQNKETFNSATVDISVTPAAGTVDVVWTDQGDLEVRVPEGLVVAHDSGDGNGYTVEFFRDADVPPKANGVYSPTPGAAPVARYSVANPAAAGTGSVRVTNLDVPARQITSIQTPSGWKVERGANAPSEEIVDRATTSGYPAGSRIYQTIRYRSPEGAVDSKTSEIRSADGHLLATIAGDGSEAGPAADAIQTDYTRDGDGKIESVTRGDGTYEKYTWVGSFDSPVFTRTIIRPWLDLSAAGANASNRRATVEQHQRAGLDESVTMIEKINGLAVSEIETISMVADAPSPPGVPTQSIRTTTVRRQAPGAPETVNHTL